MRTPADPASGKMVPQTQAQAQTLAPAPKRTLIVAGGGSAGHIHAGFAIAEAWMKRFGDQGRVVFICSNGAIERKVLPREKYPYVLISLGSLNRVSRFTQLKTFFQLPWAFARSLGLILKERPMAVIGVGGYASGPPVMLAGMLGRALGMRSAFIEQNAVPGMTNRLLKPFVHQVFAVFEELKQYFDEGMVVATGNPIRQHFERMPSSAEKLVSDPNAALRLFIFGGSQGALGMNTVVLDALPLLKQLGRKVEITHQTGEIDYERVKAAHQKAGTGARVEKFIYTMAEEYRAAHLVISRAGMSTLSELAAVGRAAILVPLPTAADNHQEKNARVYESAHAARVAVQKTTTGEQLFGIIKDLVDNPGRLREMEQNVVKFHRPDAAKSIVDHLV